MIFELPTDNSGVNTVSAWSFGPGNGSFACFADSFNPNNSPSFSAGAMQTFNPTGQMQLTFSVNVNPGWSLRLNCDNGPVSRGIGGLNW